MKRCRFRLWPDPRRERNRRNSLRLANWNYAGSGWYFVTVNTKNRQPFLGRIHNRIVCVSPIGALTWRLSELMEEHYPFARVDTFIAMPDHLHLIVRIWQPKGEGGKTAMVGRTGSGLNTDNNVMLEQSLGRVVRWFKGRVTFEARKTDPAFAWHRGFQDRIIPDFRAYMRVRRYILTNPERWTPLG